MPTVIPAPNATIPVKVKVWTLASDTDFGTVAEVFATEREADIARIKGIIGDYPKELKKALDLYEAGEEDALEDLLEEQRDPMDTYSVDSHEVVVQVPADQLKAQ